MTTYGIAAAGTGGHVFPALAVAEELVRLGSSREDVVFFGGHRMAADVIPAAGYELVQFEISGLQRRLTLQNLRVAAQVVAAQREMAAVIRSRGIKVLLATGGYVTGPAALAARRTRTPLVIHEQNAIPGLANRLAARLAQQVLVAFPDAAEKLKGAVVVGNPLRRALSEPLPDSGHARRRYGLTSHAPVVGVVGGSLGADALNQAAARLAEHAADFQILHLAGPETVSQWQDQSASFPTWKVVPFEQEMEYFYAASDFVIARAGALTVSELAATRTPSILVPYVHGTAGHQEANAAQLVAAGAAEILLQRDLRLLPGTVSRWLAANGDLAGRAGAAAAVARPDAAHQVAIRLQELAGG